MPSSKPTPRDLACVPRDPGWLLLHIPRPSVPLRESCSGLQLRWSEKPNRNKPSFLPVSYFFKYEIGKGEGSTASDADRNV